ncbi:MAG: PAS domain-containing protein [Proteobacteria bacterium]|nr:PAS domain-containing protein [Pseudomonadota bacterium]MBU1387512.1 PAS domain-containing protein [Pseudomonadota bacterium]MBU1543187.1 PAS domain-containing protein [Pseudomonadota bacterium]MBU2480069.1 PAS domain-containing protein [Pseudomonadota bacterium]
MEKITKDKIRKRAEKIARKQPVTTPDIRPEDCHQVAEELNIHKIELELQNEELRNTQVHLEYNKNKFAELFNNAPVSFIVLDSGGYILEANRTFLKKTGSGMEAVLRKPFHNFLKTDSKRAFLGQYKSFFKNPAEKTIDVELETKENKPIIVRLYGSKEDYARDESPDENLRVAAIDITAQIEAERKQQSTIQRLIEANLKIKEQQMSIIEQERLTVVLQMAGATAHELNQPLMHLLGSLDLMEMDKDNPLERERHLKNIRRAGERIASISRQIQSIHHDRTKPYPGGLKIIQLDQGTDSL